MVTKSFTPNTDATPSTVNSSATNGLPAAAPALVTLNDSGSIVSSVNFIAFGFGVGEGTAMAMARWYAPRHDVRMTGVFPDRMLTPVVDSLDVAWDALSERLDGLTDEEYGWEPVDGCWTVRRVDGAWTADWADPDPVPAPVTTIAWRLWHLAVDCFDSYSSRLFGTTGTGLSGRAWVDNADVAFTRLGEAWSVFRSGVAAWDDDLLWRPLGADWGPVADKTNLDLALHAKRELIHHGAEIALLRDLFAATGGARLG